MWKFFLASLLLELLNYADSANILAIFPVPSQPHQKVFRALTEALEERGHHLTIISTDPQLSREHPNTTEIDLSFSYTLLQKALFSMSFKEAKNELDALATWFEYELEILEKQFESDDVQYLLRNRDEKFDLVLVESVGHTPWHAFAEYFSARLVGITAGDANLEFHDLIGNAANPIRDPDLLLPTSDEMSFGERFRAWWFYLFYNFYYKTHFHAKFDELIHKFMPSIRSDSQQLKEAVDLMLINTHPALLNSRPMVPTSVQLGFLHVKPPRELEDAALKRFLDDSEKSVIYMSFGTSVKASELQEPLIEMFQNVFRALPTFNVVWKWEAEEMKNKPDNVFITQWAPQADLLAHPKIKLFITHGGQLSIEEAIDRAVPMLVIPFFADQARNSIKVQQLSIGLAADLQSMNEKFLRQLIDEVVYGQYRENILRLQKFVHDAPTRPVDRAVWWIEYVIRHNGTEHLKYPGRNVPFYQKYMLDFAAIAIVVWHIWIWISKILLGKAFAAVSDYAKKRIARKNENPVARKIKKKKNKEE